MSDFRTIPLTRGLEAIVDAADYEGLSMHKWRAKATKSGYYAVRSSGDNDSILMHRVILNASDGVWVDHINGDTLDNRRSNIRLCTPAQNNCNSAGRGSRSGFKGVVFHPGTGKWQARIGHHGRSHYIGLFPDRVSAAAAYDAEAIRLHGAFARLNFARAS